MALEIIQPEDLAEPGTIDDFLASPLGIPMGVEQAG